MKVLLANIGNRNITYKDDTFVKSVNMTFRDWSQNLLDNYEEFKKDIELNIINPLINPKRFNHLVLFYSDQSDISANIRQDTLFAAEIIKKKIIDKELFKAEDITLIKVEAEVINNKNLLQFYRNTLKKYKTKFSHFTICDAGGTPQQKMSLKIMAEFILPKDSYEVIYVQNNEDEEQVDVDEYKSIIKSEIAIGLLHQGDYSAVNDMLNIANDIGEFHNSSDYKAKLYAHVFFRYTGNRTLAMANLSGKERTPELNNYHRNVVKVQKELENKKIPNTDWIDITDKLLKSYHLLNRNKYSEAVLAFSQFYEGLFTLYLKKYEPGLWRYGKKGEENLKKLLENNQELSKKTSLAKQHNKKYKSNVESLATQCIICTEAKVPQVKEIAELLAPRIDYTHIANKDDSDGVISRINGVRNKVAHDGFYLTQNDIDNGYGYIRELIQESVDVFKFENPYIFETLNALVEEKYIRV